MSPEDLGQAAYEAHVYRLKRLLERRNKYVEFKTWRALAKSTKEAWVCAAMEVVHLTRPKDEVLRQAAIEGYITLRVEEEPKNDSKDE